MDTGGQGQRRVEMDPATDQASTRQPDSGGIGSTIGAIVEDLQNVVRGEVQLAKTEIKEDVSDIGKGAGMIAGGAIVALVGFIFLMLSVTYILDLWMRLWIAAGIVAILLLVIGGVVAMIGKNQLSASNLKPEQTMESLKEDQEWANQQMKSVKK